jgi:hypothetical protein
MALTLTFERFPSFIAARKEFRGRPCVYIQTDSDEKPLRVGESDDLWKRYFGGTAYALEAAGHGGGNLYFVADAPADRKERCRLEATLIYSLQPRYNNQHMKRPPVNPAEYSFAGSIPRGLQIRSNQTLQPTAVRSDE